MVVFDWLSYTSLIIKKHNGDKAHTKKKQKTLCPRRESNNDSSAVSQYLIHYTQYTTEAPSDLADCELSLEENGRYGGRNALEWQLRILRYG